MRWPFSSSHAEVVETTGVDFVDPADDTAENRAIVAVVEQRRAQGRGGDRDLDEAIAELGYDPAEFLDR